MTPQQIDVLVALAERYQVCSRILLRAMRGDQFLDCESVGHQARAAAIATKHAYDALVAEIQRASGADQMTAMLCSVEWVRQSGGNKFACPFCHGISERDGGPGHTDTCEWSAAVVGGRFGD
jgi:hypothetical protein